MNERCSRPRLSARNEGRRPVATTSPPEGPSPQSRRGLDWLNFFMADVQTGFGSILSFYLADRGWSQENVGFVLTAGGLSGVVAQMPGGALVDAMRRKRLLVAIGVFMIAASAGLLALSTDLPMVFSAEVLHGATGGIIGPAIGAISLGLVGRRAMSGRIGRNLRFDASGNALTAAGLGVIAQYVSKSAIFYALAALTVPTLLALHWIHPREISYGRARNAAARDEPGDVQRIIDLFKNHHLLILAALLVLFRFAEASMMPLVSEHLGSGKNSFSSLILAAINIVPNVVVAVAAPWAAHYSEIWGRKAVLLIGFGLEAVRGVLFALSASSYFIIAVQIPGGLVGAIMTVIPVLVITDLTTGTGRFNLARGVVGTCTGIAASLSTSATGLIATTFGETAGLLTTAGIAALAAILLWLFLPETKPQEYLD
jgi:predicted MFS family arabinose efflux permease